MQFSSQFVAQVRCRPQRGPSCLSHASWKRISQEVDRNSITVRIVGGGIPECRCKIAVAVERAVCNHLAARAIVNSGSGPHNKVIGRLPRHAEPRPKVEHVGGKWAAAFAVAYKLLSAGQVYAIEGKRYSRIKIFQPVVRLGATAKNV